MKIKDYVFGAKTWVDDNWHAPDNHVAAGDLAHGGMTSDVPSDFPGTFLLDGEDVHVGDYK